MNQARISFIRENVSILNDKKALPILEQLKGIKILDIGCGGGLVAESLARLGADVSAIDPSEENIRAAKLHSSLDPLTKNIRYYNQSVESMSQSSEKFDVVCVLEVIGKISTFFKIIEIKVLLLLLLLLFLNLLLRACRRYRAVHQIMFIVLETRIAKLASFNFFLYNKSNFEILCPGDHIRRIYTWFDPS